MPHEFDPCEAPIEGEVDKWGFTIKPTISDDELILMCLRNAPCGSDRKQALRLIQIYENKGESYLNQWKHPRSCLHNEDPWEHWD
jgi:hypothetical protein